MPVSVISDIRSITNLLLSGLVFSLHFGLLLSDFQKSLVLVFQLGLDRTHVRHFGISRTSHAINKGFDFGHSRSRIRDIVS